MYMSISRGRIIEEKMFGIIDNEDIEVTLKTELPSNNHQTNTNESTDIDWF
jgi:hypothetical protein